MKIGIFYDRSVAEKIAMKYVEVNGVVKNCFKGWQAKNLVLIF